MNTRTCFWCFGRVIFNMASNFFIYQSDYIPIHQETQIFHLGFSKEWPFGITLNPVVFNFFSVSYNFSKWSDQSPLVIIISSSMYAQINSNPRNISFIFAWKMSGELQIPIGRILYLYFPHGRIIVHRLLASLIRHMQ